MCSPSCKPTPLTSVGSYCVVFDTIVEDARRMFPDRPLGPGQQPKDRCKCENILKTHPRFESDKQIDQLPHQRCAGRVT